MKALLSLILIVVVSSASSVFLCAQTTQDQDEVVRFRTNEVKLDVVVKDKKGRPVRDLKQSDFEVTEDGVPQRVESFRFVIKDSAVIATADSGEKKNTSTAATTPTVTATPTGPAARTTPAITALVFDRLSPEARALARKAGLSYAQQGIANGDFTGVFGIDQSLRTIQSFTDNSELVKVAVERATGSTNSTFASNAPKIRDNSDRSNGFDQEVSSNLEASSAAGSARDGAGASAAASAAGQAAADQKLLEMQTQMLEHYEQLERDQQGFATINSLLAVISPMQNLPGRKTIIFFSEGLSLPPNVQMKFPAVINAANRANVSIYAIDAGGLRIQSDQLEAAREINQIASKRMSQMSRGNDSGTSGPYTKSLERNEDLLRLDPRSGLGELADETGGFLIHDTNDLTAGLRRINDDMHSYYFLTYVPENKDYDGRFRQINVKVTRPNVEIQSRKGYYAVESVGQLPMLDYEAPAIAAAAKFSAVGSTSRSTFHGSALNYPASGRSGLVLFLAEAPLTNFKFSPGADNKTYNTDFSVVALVRDQTDRVVQKLSQHYPLTGPIQNMEAAKKEELLFYREAQLPPGKYNVELISYDNSTSTVNVSSMPLEVTAVDETKPRLSSVVILRRADRLSPDEQKRDQPLRFGELLIYPNLGETINRNVVKQLAFFFTAWPPRGTAKPMQVTLEIWQNKRRLGQTSAELPAADDQGQIKYASAFPLDKFQPGVYELQVTVSDGKNSATRSTQFTLGN